MPLVDKESELYAAIRALLEADDSWTGMIADGNRTWYDDPATENDPDNDVAADGDYPSSILYLKSGTNNLFDNDTTFATHAPEFDPENAHWIEQMELVYELRLASQLISIVDADKLCAASRKAIRKGGPRLGGKAGVVSIRLDWDTDATDSEPEVHEMRRFLTKMRIRVRVESDGNEQLGD